MHVGFLHVQVAGTTYFVRGLGSPTEYLYYRNPTVGSISTRSAPARSLTRGRPINYMHMGSAGHVSARAEELYLRGRHNESYFEAQKAIHVDPSSGSTYDRLGVLLHRRSQDLSQDPIYRQLSSHLAHEAVQLFRHALALDPTNGETYYHLAAALGSEVERLSLIHI